MSCLKMKRFGVALACQADEGLVVVFDDAGDFFAVLELDPDRRRVLDQVFEILGLLKRLFRGARGLSCRGVMASPSASS